MARRYYVEIEEEDVKRVEKLLRRVIELHREGKIRLLGLVFEGEPQKVGGLNRTVAEIRIKRAVLKQLMLIEE